MSSPHEQACLELYSMKSGAAKPTIPPSSGPFAVLDKDGKLLGNFPTYALARAYGIFLFVNERQPNWVSNG